MPITLLPDHTIRAIGSFLVLNDACSVVKELVDNSLDSKATAITIEISSNTLDLIQVKDNGIGIGPEDRPHVCKANYTSKIETIEDLTTIGATSLGFRGQALASVAELSGETIVTTRIDGEIVGTKLKYHRDGSLVRWCYQPVGDVRLTEFQLRNCLTCGWDNCSCSGFPNQCPCSASNSGQVVYQDPYSYKEIVASVRFRQTECQDIIQDTKSKK